MTIRHNFYVFFAASYIAFLIIGSGLGFGLASAMGWNIGYIVNLLSFVAALKVATSNSDIGPLKIFAPPRYFFYSKLRESLKTLSVVFALLAVLTDAIFFVAVSYHFHESVQLLPFGRLLLMTLAYAVLGYALLDIFAKQGTSLSRHEGDAAQCFVEGFEALGKGDKSVLIASLKLPGSPMLTTSGSANDFFWHDLSRYGLTKRVALPEGIENSEVSEGFAAWTLTEKGSRLISFLLHTAGKTTH